MLVMVETMERQLDRIYTELDALRGKEGVAEIPTGGSGGVAQTLPTTNSIGSGGVAKTQTLPTTDPTGSGGVAKTQAPPTTDPIGSGGVAKTQAPPTTELTGSEGMAAPTVDQSEIVGVATTQAPPTIELIGVANTEAPPTTELTGRSEFPPTTLPATAGDVISETHDRNRTILSRMRKVEVSAKLHWSGSPLNETL